MSIVLRFVVKLFEFVVKLFEQAERFLIWFGTSPKVGKVMDPVSRVAPVVLLPLGLFYLFVVPALIAGGSSSDTAELGGIGFGLFLYIQLMMLMIMWAGMALVSLYGIQWQGPPIFRYFRPNQALIAIDGPRAALFGTASAMLSYVVSIYGFAVCYLFISNRVPGSFSATPLNLIDTIYFSTVTATTVGYGDITPTDSLTRLVVTAQLGISLLYVVFFFSIMAGALQSRSAPRLPDSDDEHHLPTA